METNEDYYEQINLITDARVREKGEFDKRIFYTITSFFAFSIALAQFIEKPIFYPQILVLSWCFDILALVFHLFGYWFVDKALNLKREMFIKKSSSLEEMFQ